MTRLRRFLTRVLLGTPCTDCGRRAQRGMWVCAPCEVRIVMEIRMEPPLIDADLLLAALRGDDFRARHS